MPEQNPPDAEQNTAQTAAVSFPQGPSILSRLHLALFLGGVVVVECLVAYLYIPGAEEAAAMTGATSNPVPEADLPLAIDEQDVDLEDQIEVDLGEFSVTAFQPISSTTLRIDFHLYGTIHVDDKKKFEYAWDENTHRFRDQVIMTIRSCEFSELTDAGLGLIKRKILEKSNRTLGKPLLQSVVFSDFALIEQ